MAVLGDLWDFMKHRKRFWLLPMLSVLILFALLLTVGRGSSSAFVYTLF
jgi:hypothetical protein